MANTDIPPEENLETQQTEASNESENSLEGSNTDTPNASHELEAADATQVPEVTPQQSSRKNKWLQAFRQSANIYLLLFGAIILMALIIVVVTYEQSRRPATNNGTLQTQNLSQSTLNKLADSDATVGSSQYILNVESSAVFAGQVVMRQNLEVAGNLQIGGTSAFNNIVVGGTGQFSQATINNNLTVGGNSAVQGSATIAKTLQVNNGGTFGGTLSAPQITTSSLQLNGDLVLQHHISSIGPGPSRSPGPALGSGGSASISGTDTAGSISINTSSNPPAGCFVTVNFSAAYNNTPHILVTPIGSAAGGLSYYINRSTTGFSICDAASPPAASSFGFDYFVID